MKLRHVRAVAVTAAVLVALTGARKSDGGGCSGDDDGGGSSVSASGAGGTGSSGGSGSSGGRQEKVMREITVVDCAVGPDGKAAARLRIRNTGRMDMTYSATVAFGDGRDGSGGTAVLEDFEVPAGETLGTEVRGGAYPGAEGGSEDLRCDVVKAARTL